VTNALGALISGGQVRVYDANTTTLSDLFSDTGLAVPLTNPVVADANGFLTTNGSTKCLVFAADGNYDVAILDAGGNLIASYEDVPAVGADAATLTKDFTNSRFKVSGTAGLVNIEVGDPDPDATGGSFRLGGWAGTQADDGEIDAATTNFTGDVTVKDGKKLQGYVLTAATTFTAAGTVDVALTESPADARGFQVDFFDLSTSAGTIIFAAQFSYDGGGTYKSGASDYAYEVGPYYDQAGGTLGGISHDDAHTHILLNGVGSAQLANKPYWLTLKIITPESGAGGTVLKSELIAYDQPGTWPVIHRAAGYGLGGYGRATHVRLFATTGGVTLTGKYRTAVLLGFGD
jgi:hypothetical protein